MKLLFKWIFEITYHNVSVLNFKNNIKSVKLGEIYLKG